MEYQLRYRDSEGRQRELQARPRPRATVQMIDELSAKGATHIEVFANDGRFSARDFRKIIECASTEGFPRA